MAKARKRGRACAVVFPFDLFGSGGTGAGAQLLGDALREAVEDTALEEQPSRPAAFADRLEIAEVSFDTMPELAAWRKTGRKIADERLGRGEFLLWLAGNHLGVLPVYEALGPETLVVQFDAHLDCYDLHDTATELSHGNWMRHANPRPSVVNVASRDLFLTADSVAETFAAVHAIDSIAANTGAVAADLRERVDRANRVWIDIDADAFDPAFAPGVSHPSPFGLTPPQFLFLFEACWSDKLAGVSISEFDPGRDVRDATLNLLGWLTERILLRKFE